MGSRFAPQVGTVPRQELSDVWQDWSGAVTVWPMRRVWPLAPMLCAEWTQSKAALALANCWCDLLRQRR